MRWVAQDSDALPSCATHVGAPVGLPARVRGHACARTCVLACEHLRASLATCRHGWCVCVEATWMVCGGRMDGLWRPHGWIVEGAWMVYGGRISGSGGRMDGVWRPCRQCVVAMQTLCGGRMDGAWWPCRQCGEASWTAVGGVSPWEA